MAGPVEIRVALMCASASMATKVCDVRSILTIVNLVGFHLLQELDFVVAILVLFNFDLFVVFFLN